MIITIQYLMNQSSLQKKIMRRIYFMYVLRKAISRRACQMYAFMTLWVMLFSVVSVTSVLANMPHQPLSLVDYTLRAFINTEVAVQFTILALMTVAAWFVVDVVRGEQQVAYRRSTVA